MVSESFVSQCVEVCCSMLQCVAVSCSELQCVAVCCSVLHCVAVCCSVCTMVSESFVCLNVLKCVAVCCSVLQYVAVSTWWSPSLLCVYQRCNTLPNTTTHPLSCVRLLHTKTHPLSRVRLLNLLVSFVCVPTLQYIAKHCNTLQYRSILSHVYICCTCWSWVCFVSTLTMQHTTTHWNTLPHGRSSCAHTSLVLVGLFWVHTNNATHYNILKHIATWYVLLRAYICCTCWSLSCVRTLQPTATHCTIRVCTMLVRCLCLWISFDCVCNSLWNQLKCVSVCCSVPRLRCSVAVCHSVLQGEFLLTV